MRAYGLMKVYKKYLPADIYKAKRYLRSLAADQIQEDSVETYLSSRKIHQISLLKEYILSFKK